MEERPILSNNEKLALMNAGETTSRIMTLDGRTADDIIMEREINKFNEQVDTFAEKFENSWNSWKWVWQKRRELFSFKLFRITRECLRSL